MPDKTEITDADVIDDVTYGEQRKQRRAEMIQRKKNRRLSVGPNATLYFENYDTMLYQVQEMLFIEKGGDEQLEDELDAYNPLIPQGKELVSTFMLEYPDPVTRPDILRGLTGIEETISLNIAGEKVAADWEIDIDRTAPDGKTSSIHFIRFKMTDEQVDKFKDADVPVMLSIGHENYNHAAGIVGGVRQDLIGDL